MSNCKDYFSFNWSFTHWEIKERLTSLFNNSLSNHSGINAGARVTEQDVIDEINNLKLSESDKKLVEYLRNDLPSGIVTSTMGISGVECLEKAEKTKKIAKLIEKLPLIKQELWNYTDKISVDDWEKEYDGNKLLANWVDTAIGHVVTIEKWLSLKAFEENFPWRESKMVKELKAKGYEYYWIIATKEYNIDLRLNKTFAGDKDVIFVDWEDKLCEPIELTDNSDDESGPHIEEVD